MHPLRFGTPRALFALIVVLFSALALTAQTSTFTFQGRLTDASMPASGTYQMQFALYDAPTAGTQIGTTIDNVAVAVSNGVFTVQLDYGAAAFSGAERYLEISVRRASGDSYTVLNPRQRVTSSPHALRAASAGTADNASSLGGTPAASYVQTSDPRLSDARTPTAGSGDYIQNQNGGGQTANFNISGTGTAGSFNAAQYSISGSRVLTSWGNNLFVGVGAGASTGGDYNSFVGHNAGYSNTTGYANSFFGNGAGFSNSVGTFNAFLGDTAGYSNTSGHSNAFVGYNAGYRNTVGHSNAFIGSYAGNFNTSGIRNAFLGMNAGYNNTTGGWNVIVGFQAGYLNTTGNTNSFLGAFAGFGNTIGVANSMVGYSAGLNNNTGSNNSFIGYQAGSNNSTGGNNSFVGTLAGVGNVTGSYNTAIGYDSGVAPSGLTNATAIGANARVSSSNTIQLGDNNVTAVHWSKSALSSDQGGSIELGGTSGTGTPFIDFHFGNAADYNVRLVNDDNQRLSVLGHLRVTNYMIIPTLGLNGNIPLCRDSFNIIASCASSSLRYKTNVTPFGSGMDLVKQLKPIAYNWKHDGAVDLGFGAEDVAKVNPLLVIYDAKGQVEGVRYDRMSVVFVNAFKEQQQQIEAQQRRLEAQQKQIEELKAKAGEVDALKQLVCSQNKDAALCKEDK